MKIVRYVMLSLASLPNTYLLTKWWLGSWWSERTWTWLNQMFGQDTGLASDVELLLVLACAFSLSFAAITFLFWVLQTTHIVPHKKSTGHVKETIYAGLIGFWVLFTTYFFLWMGNMFGVQAADGASGLSFWVYLSVSFIIVLVVTLFGLFLWHRAQNALTHHSTRAR